MRFVKSILITKLPVYETVRLLAIVPSCHNGDRSDHENDILFVGVKGAASAGTRHPQTDPIKGLEASGTLRGLEKYAAKVFIS